MTMNNKTYDILKWITLVVLPAFATLWTVVSDLWGFGYAIQIVGTITAIDAFLGAVLGISSATYSSTTKKATKSTKTTKKTDK